MSLKNMNDLINLTKDILSIKVQPFMNKKWFSTHVTILKRLLELHL